MKEYTNNEPVFSKSIQIVETTDAAHADNINAATKTLLENTLVLKNDLMITETATGERITVDNSADASVREFGIDGKMDQLTTSGKNLLDFTNFANISHENAYLDGDSIIIPQGNSIYGIHFPTMSDILEVGKTYTFSVESISEYSSTHGWRMLYEDDTFSNTLSSICTFEITKKVKDVYFYAYYGQTSISNIVISKFQIEEGAVATEYEPYTNGASPNPDYPQDIKGAGDGGEVEVTVTGKNLLTPLATSITTNGVTFTSNQDGSMSLKGTTTADTRAEKRITNTVELEAGEYIFSIQNYNKSKYYIDIKITRKNGNAIWVGSDTNDTTFTIYEGDTLSYSSIIVKTNSTVDATIYPMIRKAEITDGTYEPYKIPQTVKIPVSSPLYDGDYIRLKNGKLETVRNNIQEILDNTNNKKTWSMYTENGVNQFYFLNTNVKHISGQCSVYSPTFRGIDIAYRKNNYETVYTGMMANTSVICFNTQITTSVSEWRAFLEENPVTVIYKAVEPIIEVIETDIDLYTYSHVTNFTNSDNANMEVEYFVNNRHADMVTEMMEEIERLDNEKATKNSPTFEDSISMGRKEGSTRGENSFAAGVNVTASDKASYAEGIFTQSLGEGTHVEGYCPRGIYLEIVDGQEGYRLLDQNKSKLPNWLNGYYWDAGIESTIETNGMPLYGLGLYDVEDKTLLKATIIKTYTVQTDDGYDLYAILDTDLSAEISANPDRGYYTYYGKAIKRGSHAEGGGIALGDWGHAEGSMTWAAGQGHAEGHMCAAMNTGSHAENIKNIARGKGSHAQGTLTQALGDYSHTEGIGTKAASKYQHVQGKYNVEDTEEKYAHIVGGGTSDTDRKNIHTVDWNGNAKYAGDVKATDADGNAVSLLALKSLVVNEKYTTRVYSENGKYYIGKSNYIPTFVKINVLHSSPIICLCSKIGSDENGYYVEYDLCDVKQSGITDEIEIEVLYVRDI